MAALLAWEEGTEGKTAEKLDITRRVAHIRGKSRRRMSTYEKKEWKGRSGGNVSEIYRQVGSGWYDGYRPLALTEAVMSVIVQWL